MLDEAAKAVADTPPQKTTSSGAPAPVAENVASATQGNAAPPARKN
jgi:hypothetical protein